MTCKHKGGEKKQARRFNITCKSLNMCNRQQPCLINTINSHFKTAATAVIMAKPLTKNIKKQIC